MRRLFKKLRRKLDYLDDERIEQIRQAYLYALEGHKGQKRRTGEPYITHPVDVACVLADYKLDHLTVMGALLHDTIEDTFIEKEDIEERFGDTVANIVDGVSKLDKIHFTSRVEAQAENFRKLILAMSQDIRVIFLKLADRLHNMRTLGTHHMVKKRRIARETLEIYAPIAKRLGMRDLSVELEEISFREMYPMRYRVLQNAVKRARGDRKKILMQIENTFRDGFQAAKFPICQIIGREKHLYSIYRKMKNKKLSFNEIMDVYAFRMIVDDVDTCYRVLGLVHSLYKPVAERFKDYIAIPKANGYQSLHTTLFGPYGLPIEVQIRTTEMDRMANQGIAAHWMYKVPKDGSGQATQHSAEQWVQNLLEMQRNTGSSLEFIENVKVDLFPDEVYVFTPKGHIKSLPAGATVIDFAYSVHTDIGNHCVSARVDRQVTSLSAQLVNGQTIEVITSPNARPQPAWVDFAVTGKAKNAIRHFLKNCKRSESISLGRKLLKQALVNYSISMRQLSTESLQPVLQEMQLTSFDDMLEQIGLGNRIANLVAEQLVRYLSTGESVSEPASDEPITVQGTEGMTLDFARCCHPIPGDAISGVITVGQGVVVHKETCPSLMRLRRNPSRVIPLRWSQTSSQDFVASLAIELTNRRGTLAELALAASDAGANIEDIQVTEREGAHCMVRFELRVQDRGHLAAVLRRFRRLSAVLRIDRL
jgi:guanosine-3',5'-bis(diphosphate) 3'-pyrophosphohydrolase